MIWIKLFGIVMIKFQEIWAKQLVPPFSTNKDNSELTDDVGGIFVDSRKTLDFL